MGRSAESIERRKAYNREKKQRLWRENPEFRAKVSERRKAHYAANAERYREANRERYRANKEQRNAQRAAWARENKERQLEYQRAYYRENAEHLRKIIYESRNKRDPTRGLYGELTKLDNGSITIDQFIESVGKRIIQLNERVKTLSTGHSGEVIRSGQGADSCILRTTNRGVDENET